MNVRFSIAHKNDPSSLILCHVTWKGRRVRITSGLSCKPCDWNQTEQSVKDSPEINKKLEALVKSCHIFYDYNLEKGVIPSVKDFQAHIKEKTTPALKAPAPVNQKNNLLSDFEKFIDTAADGSRLNQGRQFAQNTIVNYRTVLGHLKSFSNKYHFKLKYENMTDIFYDKFCDYLIKKGLTANSQGRMISVVKTFLRYALDKGLHNNAAFISKFHIHTKDSTLIALTMPEIKEIINLDLSGNEKMKLTRDNFLIQCFTGLRFSDLKRLQPNNVDYYNMVINIVAQKTQDMLTIPITDIMRPYIGSYIFYVPKLSLYNRNIKALCKLAGINQPIERTKFIGGRPLTETKAKYELISSHTARRTFVTLSLSLGILPKHIMGITGHKQLQTMEKYIKFAQGESLAAVSSAWDRVTVEKE